MTKELGRAQHCRLLAWPCLWRVPPLAWPLRALRRLAHPFRDVHPPACALRDAFPPDFLSGRRLAFACRALPSRAVRSLPCRAEPCFVFLHLACPSLAVPATCVPGVPRPPGCQRRARYPVPLNFRAPVWDVRPKITGTRYGAHPPPHHKNTRKGHTPQTN